ncbi:MAG: polyphenol oxidase family protein [Rubrimonas sp.]|uniref:polyphenol oxidase family protein n=1 Tax=Rubrimonas sp. TaxID=2036015 RepID=UPI002FDE15DE
MSLAPIRSALLANAPHGFFTREGGVSQGLYDGLNCGPGSGDDPAAVAENRRRVADALGVAETHLLTAHQVHSARAARADAPFEGARPQVDALVTVSGEVAVGALSADCAPVLLLDAGAGVAAAAHAGWRGALDGVLDAAVAAMVAAGARRSRVVAAIGPCISQRAYEVGPEFVERFLDEDRAFGRFFAAGDGDRAQFDLPGFCLDRLRAAGLARAEWVGACTASEPERFFSWRRASQAGARDYGRLIAAIRPPARRA